MKHTARCFIVSLIMCLRFSVHVSFFGNNIHKWQFLIIQEIFSPYIISTNFPLIAMLVPIQTNSMMQTNFIWWHSILKIHYMRTRKLSIKVGIKPEGWIVCNTRNTKSCIVFFKAAIHNELFHFLFLFFSFLVITVSNCSYCA